MRITVWAMLLALLCGGCSSKNESVVPEGETTASATIDSTGGTLVSKDGLLNLLIPAGALATETKITIAKAESVASGHLGTVYELGPAGHTFVYPVQLTMPYEPSALGGADPVELWVATEREGQWQPIMSSSVDQDKGTVLAEVTHFSKFAKVIVAIGTMFEGETGGPCGCNTEVFQECCISNGPVNPLLQSSWTTVLSVQGCGCANAYAYAMNDCYEEKAGFERGGCTKCERKCCKVAGGYTFASNSICGCSKAEARPCLDACKASGNDLTTCELIRPLLDSSLADLDGQDHRLLCSLLKRALRGQDPASCAPALTTYLAGCETLDLSQCELKVMDLGACVLAVGQAGCSKVDAPECNSSCAALSGADPVKDAGVPQSDAGLPGRPVSSCDECTSATEFCLTTDDTGSNCVSTITLSCQPTPTGCGGEASCGCVQNYCGGLETSCSFSAEDNHMSITCYDMNCAE